MFLDVMHIPEVYLYREIIDFRNGINGLIGIVEFQLCENVLSGKLFVFTNKSKDKIKILYWDRNGFCLWQKRLEKFRFYWPSHLSDDKKIILTMQQMKWLLEGYNLRYLKPHPELKFEKI